MKINYNILRNYPHDDNRYSSLSFLTFQKYDVIIIIIIIIPIVNVYAPI